MVGRPYQILSLVGILGCGGAVPDPIGGGLDCPIHDAPTFELGTGALAFTPLIEGQELRMASGPQGGCHLWLAFLTDGYAERLFQIEYDLQYADTGAEIIRSRQSVRLAPAEGSPGRCTYAGFTAFLIQPWNVEDQRVRIAVTATDDLGRSGMALRTVLARWPEEVPGRPRESLCGPR